MVLPGEYLLDVSVFYNSNIWCLQQPCLTISFCRVTKKMATPFIYIRSLIPLELSFLQVRSSSTIWTVAIQFDQNHLWKRLYFRQCVFLPFCQELGTEHRYMNLYLVFSCIKFINMSAFMLALQNNSSFCSEEFEVYWWVVIFQLNKGSI